MHLHDALTRQLRAHIRSTVFRPLKAMTVMPGPAQRHLAALAAQLEIDAEVWAAQITGRDRALASATLRMLLGSFFDGPAGFDPDQTWWRTPFGQMVLATLGHPYTSVVSIRVAGDMLGMSRQGAHDLLRRGRLERTTEGLVTVSSIVRYLGITPVPAGSSPPVSAQAVTGPVEPAVGGMDGVTAASRPSRRDPRDP